MSRDDESIRLEVKTAVPLVVRRITEEDTQGGMRGEFAGCSC